MFFNISHGTFTKIDLLICHSMDLSKCKRLEIIQSKSVGNNGIKLEINKGKAAKSQNIWIKMVHF